MGLAGLFCLVHFASFGVTTRPLVTDVRYFVYLAGEVTRGAVPHLDYFENKPPLATLAGALFHALADAVGGDPLIGIRVGYLLLAALTALAAFAIFRRFGGDVAAGLGLLAHLAFGLLAVLPSVGNVPKLLMALAASVAALLLHRGRWLGAGVAGAAACMDWQVGALVVLAALATAALHGGHRRGRALASVATGVAIGLAPLLLYFGFHGALDEAWRQVVGSTLFRREAMLEQGGLPGRLARIAHVTELGCASQRWLFYVGLAGLPVALRWAWVERRDERARLLHPLLAYHVGVTAFSFVDFQYYGDLYLLLHSGAFFLGCAWVALHDLAVRLAPAPRRSLVATAALLLALACARPGPMGPTLRLVTPAGAQVTLADQREVAAAVSARIGSGTVAFLERSELLVLMRRRNALPLVYCNYPAWHYYRTDADEPFAATCTRLLLGVDADAMVPPAVVGYDAVLRAGYVIERFASSDGRYTVDLALRRPAGDHGTAPDG